jgi:predicted choloylglycine hydrolase
VADRQVVTACCHDAPRSFPASSSLVITLRPPRGAIRLRGSPYASGAIHGEGAAAAIAENLHFMDAAIAKILKRIPDYTARVDANVAFVRAVAPEVLEEVRGIADGARQPYRRVVMLNFPLYQVASFLGQECSQVLLLPARTGAHVLLGKTRDASNAPWRQIVLWHHYEDGRTSLGVHAAGTITWPGSGINSAGVALSSSGVWQRAGVTPTIDPSKGWLLFNTQLLLRDCASVDEVGQHLDRQPRLGSGVVVAADARGGAAFEATPAEVHRREPHDGVLIATNHFQTPALASCSPTRSEYPSTFVRAERMEQVLRQSGRAWTRGDLLDLLSDHEGFPQDSICRHAKLAGDSRTLYASVAQLPAGSFDVLLGQPCEALAAELRTRLRESTAS